MGGPDHHCLIRFRECRASLIARPEELFNEVRPGSTFSRLLFEALHEIYSQVSPLITIFPVLDFAWSTLTPFTVAELIVMSPNLSDTELQILNATLAKQAESTGHPVRFHPLQPAKESALTLTEVMWLFSANRQFVIGNTAQLVNKQNRFLEKLHQDSEEALCKEIETLRAARFKTFGERPALVEPNLRESAGGFMDLYLIHLLHTLINRTRFDVPEKDEPMIDAVLSNLTRSGLLITTEKDSIHDAFYQQVMFRYAAHARHKDNRDWFEWRDQYSLFSAYSAAGKKDLPQRMPMGGSATEMMKIYYKGAKSIFRTMNSLLKHILYEEQKILPEYLEESFDNNLALKLGGLHLKSRVPMSMPFIMETFYYRGLYNNSWFNDELRNEILAYDGVCSPDEEAESAAFFRKILQLEKNVGSTFSAMHELDFLGKCIPAFQETQGLGQQGAYYYYTTDEHTIRSMCFLDTLSAHTNYFGKVFCSIQNHELLYLALLFHDIAKPLGLEGHEVLGAELVQSFMEKMGYEAEETELVSFLIRYHFAMQRVAFRRDLTRQDTIDTFAAIFPSPSALDFLFLISYAILASVNPKIFTSWKEELLINLYKQTKRKLENKISDRELMHSPAGDTHLNLRHHAFDQHLSAFDDPQYSQHFTELEIHHHIEKIESGEPLSMYFLEDEHFTKFTVITKDDNFLLSKICGALAINDISIHDARIFTRNDSIVVDTFSITGAGTGKPVPQERYAKIESDLRDILSGMMQLAYEVKKSRANWGAFRRAIMKKNRKIKIKFEAHDVYSVILIHAPDMPGFLYQITRKMNELGMHIYFAKIATEESGVYDAFYVLDRNRKKLSTNYYHFIESELKEVIERL
ncbi:MAG: HD domain-containing protein [Ignavibacteriales bacterium]|nr:HD domain-containing protein [Ignavibacteriales bacterium]